MDDKIIDMIREDIRDIKKDVKSLLALKYQIFGIVTGVSLVISFLYNLFI